VDGSLLWPSGPSLAEGFGKEGQMACGLHGSTEPDDVFIRTDCRLAALRCVVNNAHFSRSLFDGEASDESVGRHLPMSVVFSKMVM
jgi:hypothetical protein